MQTFRMPDVGEGLTEAEIVRWFVEPGEQVDVNQIVCEIETAKALVELPCPFEGTVAQLHATTGEIVPVGGDLISVETADEPPAREPVLVGYGTSNEKPVRRRRRPTTPRARRPRRPDRRAPRRNRCGMAAMRSLGPLKNA